MYPQGDKFIGILGDLSSKCVWRRPTLHKGWTGAVLEVSTPLSSAPAVQLQGVHLACLLGSVCALIAQLCLIAYCADHYEAPGSQGV